MNEVKRVLINLGGWLVLPFLFLWLLCCTGCVGYIWRSNEGNYYLVEPGFNENGDPNQVQLNPHTHY